MTVLTKSRTIAFGAALCGCSSIELAPTSPHRTATSTSEVEVESIELLRGLRSSYPNRAAADVDLVATTRITARNPVTVEAATLSSSNLAPCSEGVAATKLFDDNQELVTFPLRARGAPKLSFAFPRGTSVEHTRLLGRPASLDIELRTGDGRSECVRVDLAGRAEAVEWEQVDSWYGGYRGRFIAGYGLPFRWGLAFTVPLYKTFGPARIGGALGAGAYPATGGGFFLPVALESALTFVSDRAWSLEAELAYEAWFVMPPGEPQAPGSAVPEEDLFVHGPRVAPVLSLGAERSPGPAFDLDPRLLGLELRFPVSALFGAGSGDRGEPAFAISAELGVSFWL